MPHAADCVVRKNDDDWDQTLGLFGDASIMQTRSYARARWPGYTLEHIHVQRDGRVIGAAQVVTRRIPMLRGGLAYVHFGPLWRRDGGDAEPAVFESIVCALQGEYVDGRGMLLRVRPAIFAPEPAYAVPVLEQHGFARHRDESPDRFLVDLSPTVDEIEMGFSGKWRYNLRRSRRNALDVVCVDGAEGVEQFQRLYRKMQARKTFVDTSAIDEFPAIYDALPPAFKPQVFMCRLQDEPVAAAVVSHIGDTALYLFGASSRSGTNARAGYLLQWSVLCRLKEQGCRWYDLGGDSGSAGLRQFKSGMVGRTGRIAPLPGDFDRRGSGSGSIAVRGALAGRAALLSARVRLARRWST